MDKPILIGAVAYDPRVVPIWESMRAYFQEMGPPIDYALFSNYDRQVEALLDRHIDIAWNTNLAWVKVRRRSAGACRALAMRDVDVNFTTVLVARTDAGIRGPADLRGKRLALGSADSAQAAILPIHFVQQAGIEPQRDCTLLRFERDVGKHGDTGSSELEVLSALRAGRADAGMIGTATWKQQLALGRVDTDLLQAVWSSPGYGHCNFTVLDSFPHDLGERWTKSLLAMSYDNPRWRPLMDQEGLQRWLAADPAFLESYRVLSDAVERQGVA